jgi:hypothetical protein
MHSFDDKEFVSKADNLFRALGGESKGKGVFGLKTLCGPLICQIYAENAAWILARFTDMANRMNAHVLSQRNS